MTLHNTALGIDRRDGYSSQKRGVMRALRRPPTMRPYEANPASYEPMIAASLPAPSVPTPGVDRTLALGSLSAPDRHAISGVAHINTEDAERRRD